MFRQSLLTVVTDDLLLRVRWTHRLLACRTTSRGLLILFSGTQSTARSFPVSGSRCSCCRRRVGDTKIFIASLQQTKHRERATSCHI